MEIEYEDMEIGKELPPLVAGKVMVVGYAEQDVEKEGKLIGKKLVLKVDYPGIPGMEVSKLKFIKNKQVKESGLWLNKDSEGNLPHNSAVANLLRFYGCRRISQMVGKEIETAVDDMGFCIVKAY